jgi:hypothetical protein
VSSARVVVAFVFAARHFCSVGALLFCARARQLRRHDSSLTGVPRVVDVGKKPSKKENKDTVTICVCTLTE